MLDFSISQPKILTSTGPYRSCAALLDISNPFKCLIEFSLVQLGFGVVEHRKKKGKKERYLELLRS